MLIAVLEQVSERPVFSRRGKYWRRGSSIGPALGEQGALVLVTVQIIRKLAEGSEVLVHANVHVYVLGRHY